MLHQTQPVSPAAQPSESILYLSTCLIRPFKESDAKALADGGNNFNISRWMRNTFPHPYRIEDAQKWISIASSASPMRDFALCEPQGDTLIGAIGLKARDDIHHRTMEIGFWLSERYWGRGIATKAVSAFSDWTFENFPHVVRLEAEIFEGNDASVGVMKKAGYLFEVQKRSAIEKLGKVLDVLIFYKLRLPQ